MTNLDLIRELRGNVCRCGKPKQPKQTFCRKCYFSLPEEKRQALYSRVGEGYAEAYEDAICELDAR